MVRRAGDEMGCVTRLLSASRAFFIENFSLLRRDLICLIDRISLLSVCLVGRNIVFLSSLVADPHRPENVVIIKPQTVRYSSTSTDTSNRIILLLVLPLPSPSNLHPPSPRKPQPIPSPPTRIPSHTPSNAT